MADLLSAGGIVQARDAAELEERILELVRGDGDLGKRASEAVVRRKGVVSRCVSEIRECLA
jgi:hypothetical protein